jgi:hypothetical protein
MTVPADLVNRALDSLGAGMVIGELEEGTMAARAALRAYTPTLQQLLRAAHWGFARKQQPLYLLQDASGQTPNVGTGTPGMGSWNYEYAWPIDCVKVRYCTLPQQQPGQSNQLPIMANLPYQPGNYRNRQARFLISQDAVPTQIGALSSWGSAPGITTVQGQGANSQTVILSNVQNLWGVYTSVVLFPDEWDVLFQQAFVAAMAFHLSMAVLPDKKFASTVRREQMQICKDAVLQARIADGNEGWTTVSREASWISVRGRGAGYGRTGYGGYGGADDFEVGLGYYDCGWDTMNLGGSTF